MSVANLAYCVIVIAILTVCGLAEPDEPGM